MTINAPASASITSAGLATEDLGPLAWVLGEIQKSLDAAGKSLRRFVREASKAHDADTEPLRTARQQLHQAVGALQMVGHVAPARVLGAMEFAVQGFVQMPSQCTDAAVLKIDRAGFAVLDFLQAMLAGKIVSSVALFPQYRELLELGGDERVHPADLWSVPWRWVDVVLPGGVQLALVYDPAVRSKLDRDVLKVVRSGDEAAAQRLCELCLGLARGAPEARVTSFWALAAAFFEALASGLLPADVYVKRAASRLLLQYATLARGDRTLSDRLAQDLLFFCAQAVPGPRENVPRLRAIRTEWGIASEQGVDYTREQFGRFDPVVLAQARKRIEAAKEMWSTLASGDLSRLRLAADTFGQLGESLQKLHPPSLPMAQALRKAVEASIHSGQSPATELAMEVATSVLYLEAAFEDLDPHDRQLAARTVQLAGRIDRAREGGHSEPLEPWMEELYRRVSDRHTMGTVVGELQGSLGELEKSLDQFFRRPSEKGSLRTVPGHLLQMRGVFSVLGLEQAAQTVGCMRDTVEALLADQALVEGSASATRDFDMLGNNLGALGFLIDMLGYQPALAKRLFVFDAKVGELKPLMGRQMGDVVAAEVEERAVAAVSVPALTSPTVVSVAEVDAQIAARLTALAAPREAQASPIEEFSRATDSWTHKSTGPMPLPLQALPDTEVTELDEDDLQDIFLTEAREVLQGGVVAIAVLADDPADGGQLMVLRRAFHTLKGSARMVGLTDFGNAAWSFEQVLNIWLADQRPATPALLAATGKALDEFTHWVDAIAAGQPHAWQAETFVRAAEGLSGDPAPATADHRVDAGTLILAARRIAAETPSSPPLPGLLELPDLDLAPAPAALPPVADAKSVQQRDEQRHPADGRASTAHDGVEQVMPDHGDDFVSTDFLDFDVPPPAGAPFEPVVSGDEAIDFLSTALSPTAPAPAFQATVLAPSELALAHAVRVPEPEPLPEPAPESEPEAGAAKQVVPEVEALSSPSADNPVKVVGPLRIGVALYNVYLNEADEWSRQLATEVDEWALEPHLRVADSTVGLAHSLAGSSATVGFRSLSALARAFEAALQHLHLQGRGTHEQGQVLVAAAEELRRLLHQFAAGFLKEPARQTLMALYDVAASQLPVEAVPASSGVSEPSPVLPATSDVVLEDSDDAIDLEDAVDVDLFPIFEEEAAELLPQLGAALRQWALQPDDLAPRAATLRALHTLKGSARLAGAMRLGERAHRVESEIELIGTQAIEPGAIEHLLAHFDALQANFDGLRAADAVTQSELAQRTFEAGSAPVAEPMAEGRTAASTMVAEPALQPSTPDPLLSPVTPTAVVARRVVALPTPSMLAPLRPASSQMVRIRTHLLDRLVAQAGEVIITRSRLEVQLGQLRSSLTDLTGNLDRLRQQLRDVEVQAEGQMQSRLAQAKDSQQGFDPLEFDRFTRVQELTRMMAESVNDVATVQRTLQRTVQASEDDLSAQARQTRELQRGLLRTRMVEFEGISERLYRVVRQASKDTGKQVRLDITGGSIEMDRGVLERMTPAFEHLLRNCVAHGIEETAVREKAGKEAAGLITIDLRHEGNDVSVSFHDDGAGLDEQRIAERALALGLIQNGQQLTPDEAADLIYQQGFSTATQVSELAGRGIGMDVVRSQVAGLGGRIETHSRAGQGTRFTLVLPLTTAVTHVVMLRAGSTSIGVPSTLIELVQRASAADLDAAYLNEHYPFGGQQVPFYWAGALLQSSPRSERPTGKINTIVVVRSAAQRLALHVDEVLGNQEVVVKHLGPQLSQLPGMAGISVLASGSVALIYNPVALAAVHGPEARRLQGTGAAARQIPPTGELRSQLQAAAARVPLVLVVDDSITVRRVTQRLLQREGYRVALAVDGLQALERLRDERPAVVLSDIEMPRMDGFDLARNIRADASLADLPIIMITSRIAEKHRDHAQTLGVNHYLGKPYSEDQLLRLVRSYTSEAALAATA